MTRIQRVRCGVKMILLMVFLPVISAASLNIPNVQPVAQSLLLDTDGLSVEEVIHHGDFSETPYGEFIHTGSNNERVWVRWAVEVRADLAEQWVVFVEYPAVRGQSEMKNVMLHILKDGEIVAKRTPVSTIDILMFTVPDHLAVGRYDFLIQFDTTLKNNPFVWSLAPEKDVRRMRRVEMVITLLTTGFVGSIVLLSLFFFYQLRVRLFLWFSICYTCEVFRITITHFPIPWLSDIDQAPVLLVQLLLTIGFGSYYWFTRRLLDLDVLAPRSDRVARMIVLLMFIALPFQLLNPGYHSSCATLLFSIPICLILLSCLIRIILQKRITPQWVPWGWLVTISGYLLVFAFCFFVRTGAIRHIYTVGLLQISIETFLFGIYSGYKVREMKTENSEARWEALHAQLNPHFVFNVMNNLGGLESVDKIDLISAEFASFLRYILTSRLKKTVLLREEMEALQHYVTMDSIRFEPKAEVSFDIPEALCDIPVTPLILQPLLENALKHSRAQELEPHVHVSAERDQRGGLTLRVVNNGNWESHSMAAGTSTGLNNLKERLALAYGRKASLTFKSDQGTVSASVYILVDG